MFQDFINVTLSNISKKQILNLLFQQHLKSWHHNGFMIGIFAYYFVLFCVGLVGNFWVITALISILKNLRLSTHQNVFIYILCLSGVDSLVIMLLPILVSDTLLFHWIFGGGFCKLYLISETTNKMLSTFILAAMSFDRYLAICRSNENFKIRTPKGTLVSVIVLVVLVVVLLMPVHLHANEIAVDEIVVFDNQTYLIGVPKCILDLGNELIVSFTVYIFSVGFCLPSVLIIFFYAQVLLHIFKHTKNVGRGRTQIPVKRITCATLMIVLFYFACWTPYWVVTMFGALAQPTSQMNTLVAKIFYVIHSLVYVNSATNWLFYAFLNNNLRDSRDLAIEKKRQRSASVVKLYPLCNNNSDCNNPMQHANLIHNALWQIADSFRELLKQK